ncbi:AAA family ATPase [Paraburkholderia strydomiana]|uniref:AAA family ATPase n=1 Tax=Paraburkholderia strydomiana TaxID=1245417 RepID=UPI0038BAA1DA
MTAIARARFCPDQFFNEHVVDSVRNKERYSALGIEFPAATALQGPLGCGKTFAVEQLFEYPGWPSAELDASTLASPLIHETSRKVSEMFEKAMQNAPSVLVVDEMEAFLADREAGGGGTHVVDNGRVYYGPHIEADLLVFNRLDSTS